MTTEIAVSNRLGIALATDSAVTISGGGHVKVFDTADKLFELSPQHPVGVMINGNMDCIGVPWEILVKDFRESEGLKQRPTIKDWTDDFLRYVESHDLISENAVARYVLHVIETEIYELQYDVSNAIRLNIFESARQGRRVNVPAIDGLIDQHLTRRTEEINKFPVADSLKDTSPEKLIESYSAEIERLAKEKFVGRELTEPELARFKAIIAEALLRAYPSRFVAGIVVAGYGADETFPSVHSVEVDGRVLGKLKYSNIDSRSIATSSDEGQVIYFAQTDVIQRLLGGADPRFVEKTAEFITVAVTKVAEAIETALRPKKLSKARATKRQALVDEVATEIVREYQNETTKKLREEFSREFDRMIALMPKQELIELAEALVSITAVERKATSDEGTVGGPIDVAFITKHEGFVWIKRKHYFAAEMNPRYFWRKYGNPPKSKPNNEGANNAE